ncbi:effector binding domain-containing protein [Rossellomorea vietnamensis]|uniref:effector binding domain-containing protein n=1 Tax=Rossellomorea vietnamensis TaxID=218284 RepID=UPI003CF1CDD2
MEVFNITEIPNGMSGFKIPKIKYARGSCTNMTIDKAYTSMYRWIKEKGFEQNKSSSFPIEIFYLSENPEDEKVEIYRPVNVYENLSRYCFTE